MTAGDSRRDERGPADAVTFDVVVPTLDESARIGALVERLLRGGVGERDRVERVIVADGGSGDATRERARAAGAHVVVAQRGRGAQLAAGARESHADVLVFLHADGMPQQRALERVRDAFDDPQCNVAAFEQHIDAAGAFYRCVEWFADRRVARRGMVYGDSGLIVRRELYARVGGFSALPLFEDVDLSRRLRVVARPRLIAGARLSISARRWQAEGALRATLRNRMLSLAFAAGVRSEQLARFYPPHSERT